MTILLTVINIILHVIYIMALDSVTASDVMDDVITPTIENDEVDYSL